MRTSWPYTVSGRKITGYGYGTSSYVMLPGFTSAGALGSAGSCNCAWSEGPQQHASAASTQSNCLGCFPAGDKGTVYLCNMDYLASAEIEMASSPKKFIRMSASPSP